MLAVTILGNNSAVPVYDRHPTSQIITVGNQLLLIDCGEGTQIQMMRYQIRRRKISHIFISHLHGDHYFGLIGLINSFALLGRLQPLHIYADKKLEHIIKIQIDAGDNRIPFDLYFNTIEEGVLVDEADFTVTAFRTEHRIPCFGFCVEEKKPARRINGEALLQYKIPTSYIEKFRKGDDVLLDDGRLIQNELITYANTPSKRYAYCADTRYTESFVKYIKGVDLMYHETTYLDNLSAQAYDRFHSTTKQAAQLAKVVEAKRLLIGHFSSKYEKLNDFEREAKEVFEQTALAIEGTTFLA
jgi:ribonuclease Z